MRVSVSDIEAYRYYKSHEDATLEDCLAQLRRERPPTRAMAAGSALHKLLENSKPGDEFLYADQDGFHFYFACDLDMEVSDVRELKGEVQIDTPSGPVTLVGVVDAVDRAITDYKLTGRFEGERFADSYQWRCYLMMFGASRFDYKVFVGQESTDGDLWTIREYHPLSVYRYPGMEDDVYREVAEFAAFSLAYLHKAA